jgi:hypothetical protein
MIPVDGVYRPPEKVGRPRTPLPADTTTTDLPALTKNQAAVSDSNGADAGRHCHAGGWRRRDLWRESFGYGFRDALRLAQREIDDPHVWLVLDRLACEYDLAGDS